MQLKDALGDINADHSFATRTYLKIKLVSDMLYNWEHVTSER